MRSSIHSSGRLHPFIRTKLVHCLTAVALFGWIAFLEANPSDEPQPVVHVRDRLSAEAFEESGLSKLSEFELRLLSGNLFGWKTTESVKLHASTAAPIREPEAEEERFGEETLKRTLEAEEDSLREIRTRIEGNFDGWNGETVFRLTNGQVWKQVDDKTFVISEKEPEVSIQKGMFGAYYLSIEGYGARCKVKRVK